MSLQVSKSMFKKGLMPSISFVLALSMLGCNFVSTTSSTGVKLLSNSDRRSKGTIIDDRNLALRIFNDIKKQFPRATHVNVNVYDTRVLLTGEAESETIKQDIYNLVSKMQGIRMINNEIVAGWPTSPVSRMTDSALTTKVKAAFIDTKGINANAFVVTTERSYVYLMGRVTRKEAQIAAETTASVPGVQKVVALFDLINENELDKAEIEHRP